MICKQCAHGARSLGHARCMARNVGKHTKDCDCQHRTYKGHKATRDKMRAIRDAVAVIKTRETKDVPNEHE